MRRYMLGLMTCICAHLKLHTHHLELHTAFILILPHTTSCMRSHHEPHGIPHELQGHRVDFYLALSTIDEKAHCTHRLLALQHAS